MHKQGEILKTRENKSAAGISLSVIGQREGCSFLIGCSGFPTETVISRKTIGKKKVCFKYNSLFD